MRTISERKLAWGFGLTLVVLAINALVSYQDLAELHANTRRTSHSREILKRINLVASAFKDAESARRGYFVDGNPADRLEFNRAADRVMARIDELHNLTSEHPDQHKRSRQIEQEARARLGELRASILRADAERPDTFRQAFGDASMRDRLRDFFRRAKELEDAEEAELNAWLKARRAYILRTYATFSIASTLALFLIGSIFLLVRRYLAARKQAELTLQESEARVRLLLDSAGEGVYGVDTRGLCTFCNPAALQLLGLESADQILGRNVHSQFHHTRTDGTPYPFEECPIFRTFVTGEGTLGEEEVFWRADGTPLPVEYRAHPVRRDGETLGAVVTFVDVAPRQRAETEMRLRDRALRAIAQGVFITDPQTLDEPIIYVNAAFERLTGYSQAEVEGRNIDFLIGPDTDPLAVEEVRSAFRDRRGTKVELLCYRKDGSTFWDALTLAPVDRPDGRVSHFVGVVTDVTARRRDEQRVRDSEGRLRLMIESVRDYAIFSIDLGGRVSSWNTGAERLFGFSDSEILGQPTDLLFTDEDRSAGAPLLELLQAEATGRSEEERWHVRRDGTRFLASGLVTAVRDESGTLLGYTKVARDITEPKRAEVELRAAKVAAEVASRAKSTFLANMSHELRTPLNAIIGYSEMLGEEAEDRGLRDLMPDLDRIHSAGKHLLGLINDVLDLSKIEAGRMELYLEAFDLASMVRDAIATVDPMAEKAHNRIRLDLDSDLGAMHADQTKVRQAILNLLSNAIKFTERGTITVRARREGPQGGPDWITLEVADDGIGMSAEEQGRLFRPFVQADASTTRKYGGTGLGLTITRRFCQLMGGDIAVRSEPGLGSTFTIRLPADVEGRPGDVQIPGPLLVAPGPADGATVLVIDDDPTVGDLMTRVLAREGFRVEYAGGGEAGLAKARSSRPDAITLDVMMPGMDGWSVLHALKCDPELATIPVILVSFLEDKNLGYALGASEYLSKPIDRARLASLLKAYRRGDPASLAMVVDHDPDARVMVRQILEKEGWSVVEAEDGSAGLKLAEKARPDLVVLDLTMPRLDGFDFAAEFRLRPEGAGVPILVMTARDLSDEEQQRLGGKVESILRKGSTSRSDLLTEVRRHVPRRPLRPSAAPLESAASATRGS